jgi:6-phosphogluconate dehydrogenase
MAKAKFGMIGLGVMGRNFLLNVADNGFPCVGYDLDKAKVEALNVEGKDFDVKGVEKLADFLDTLETPRSIMLLVPAGKIVDAVIADLIPHLDEGDLIIDGGNSHFPDTERREQDLYQKGFDFLGVGVSGGAKGARLGPSIMIGGRKEAYDRVAPILEGVSAKVDGEPCAAHVGAGSAGHFVKMVHNGIEYAMMQLITEAYDVMKRGLDLDNVLMGNAFERWNDGRLNSYLVEITAEILKRKDGESEDFLVEKILDTAGQKGTGRWTSEAALEMGIPIPTIDAAVTMRQISALRDQRIALDAVVGDLEEQGLKVPENQPDLDPEYVEGVLLGAFLISYAQGFALMREASSEKGYDLDFAEIAKIWRGGCIIRSSLLEKFRTVFAAKPNIVNLLHDPEIAAVVAHNIDAFLTFSSIAGNNRIPHMAFSSAYSYFNACRTPRLPANLLQAQRDFFGSHTYKRVDKEGTFHTEWEE